MFPTLPSLHLLYLAHRFPFQLCILVPINIAVCLMFPWVPCHKVSSYWTLFSKSFMFYISWDNETYRISPRHLSQAIPITTIWFLIWHTNVTAISFTPNPSTNAPWQPTDCCQPLCFPLNLLDLSILFWPLVCSHHGLLVGSPIRMVTLSPLPLFLFSCAQLP